MSSTVVQPPAAPEPAALSEGARLIDTFVAPSKTFTDLKRSAMWWAPFLVIAVVGILYAYVVDKKVTFEKVSEYQVQISPKASERLDRLSPDARAHQMHISAVVTRYVSYGFFVLVVLINLLIALVLWVTYKVVANSAVKFKTSLAIVMYAGLPGALKIILAIIMLAVGGNPDSFNIQNPIGTNIGFFLDPANSMFLYSLLSRFDIFAVWTLVLSALGFAYAGNVKKSTSYAIVFGWFFLVTLIGAGLAAATS